MELLAVGGFLVFMASLTPGLVAVRVKGIAVLIGGLAGGAGLAGSAWQNETWAPLMPAVALVVVGLVAYRQFGDPEEVDAAQREAHQAYLAEHGSDRVQSEARLVRGLFPWTWQRGILELDGTRVKFTREDGQHEFNIDLRGDVHVSFRTWWRWHMSLDTGTERSRIAWGHSANIEPGLIQASGEFWRFAIQERSDRVRT
jgi:membrane protein implicated in regulation of membrane protease activity